MEGKSIYIHLKEPAIPPKQTSRYLRRLPEEVGTINDAYEAVTKVALEKLQSALATVPPESITQSTCMLHIASISQEQIDAISVIVEKEGLGTVVQDKEGNDNTGTEIELSEFDEAITK